jgi:rhodanese-related sulfurtransferase
MRKIFFLSLALILSVTGCRRRSMPVSPNLDLQHFRAFSEKGNILLDVRSPEEYMAGHIPDAINADVNGDFSSAIARFDSTDHIYLYCRSGNRGERAAALLAERGFRRVYNLDGGFEAWVEAENAVVTGPDPHASR